MDEEKKLQDLAREEHTRKGKGGETVREIPSASTMTKGGVYIHVNVDGTFDVKDIIAAVRTNSQRIGEGEIVEVHGTPPIGIGTKGIGTDGIGTEDIGTIKGEPTISETGIGGVSGGTREGTETTSERGTSQTGSTTKEEEKDNKKLKRLIPLVFIPLAAFLSLSSCERTDTVIKEQSTPIAIELYDTDNPSTILEGAVGQAGQEEMTNIYVMNNGIYSDDRQFDAEEMAVDGFSEYVATDEQLTDVISVLNDENSTSEQLEEAFRQLEQIYETRTQLYEDKTQAMDESVDRFTDATMANPDSHSETEIDMLEDMAETLEEGSSLEQTNLGQVEDINESLESTDTRIEDVHVEEKPNGDYHITGTEVTKVAEQQTYRGLRAFFENVKEWFKGMFDNTQNKDNNNLER